MTHEDRILSSALNYGEEGADVDIEEGEEGTETPETPETKEPDEEEEGLE